MYPSLYFMSLKAPYSDITFTNNYIYNAPLDSFIYFETKTITILNNTFNNIDNTGKILI
jgi:hypothetical protein